MPMKNLVQPFLDSQGITPYRFWHDTGISRVTAYKLYNDASYIPGADVLVKICDAYKIQPGVILVWTPDNEGSNTPDNEDSNQHDLTKQENKTQKQGGAIADNNPSLKRRCIHSFLAVILDLPESA